MALDELKYEQAEFEIVHEGRIEREGYGHIGIALGIKP